MNIAIFVSGNGSNLQALMEAAAEDTLGGGKIVLVVSDKSEAFALERAKKAGLRTFVSETDPSLPREENDKAILSRLKEDKVDLVVLAGFMRILSDLFVDEYKGRILNIHPSLLPSFKGVHGIKDAFDQGVKATGVTVHFVERELDSGPIILQSPVFIEEDDTLETLEEKIHKEEHKIYPEAVRLFVCGKLKAAGNKVRILK